MISFLNPAILWALPLSAAPVILHLLFLRRSRRFPFSDLTLLKTAYARALPASRLRQWLILALRCLMIAGLVAVFARPVLHSRAAAAGESDRGLDVVMLADVSWSMGARTRGRSRLEWSVSAGSALARMLKGADHVAVAPFSDSLEEELSWAPGRAAAEQTLARLKVGSRPTDISPALAAAYRFLAAPREDGRPTKPRRRVIVLLSDNAAHAFRELPAAGLRALPDFDPEVSLLGLAWDSTPDNAAVTDARPEETRSPASADPREPRQERSLVARCALFGRPKRGWGLSLWLQDKRVEERGLDLSGGLDEPRSFRLPPSAERLWGRLELRQDDLPADDVFFYSMRVQPRPRVLLLYGAPGALEAGKGGYFLRKLLGDGGPLPYALDVADMGRLGQIRLTDYGAVLLDEFRALPAGAADELKRYVLRGGGLWVIAGAQSDPETFRSLEALLPGSLGRSESFRGGASGLVPDKAPRPAGGESDWSGFELKNISIGRRYAFAPRPDAEVWFRDSVGGALLAASAFGQGRVLLWAASLDVDWMNLALKPAFAAWVDAGLRHLTRYSGRADWRTLKVAEPIVKVWEAGDQPPSKVEVRGPGGRRTTLLVVGRRLEYRDTREPGLYFLHPLGTEETATETYAVNLDRGGFESDLAPSAKPPFIGLRPDALREDFLRSVYGRELRTGALMLVLLIFLAETLLSSPRSSRTGPQASLAVGRSVGVSEVPS